MKQILYILLVFALFSCREEVNIELDNSSPNIVFEGLITDNPGPYTIKIGETSSYYESNTENGINGLFVTITDSDGVIDTLQEVEAGHYQTTKLHGETGKTYILHTSHKGEEYEASGTLQAPPIFDSLTYQYNEKAVFREEGYYLHFFGKTPKEQINYYRWLVYKNNELFNTQPEDYLLASDEFIAASIEDLEFPFAFEANDTIKIEMYGLDRPIYDYYNQLIELLFSDGGLFSPPPVNPTSNVHNLTNPKNKPLGYFQVSSRVSETIIIEED